MANGLYGQDLGTVGVEFEGVGLERQALIAGLATEISRKYTKWGNVLTVGRDASVEFVAERYKIGNRMIAVSSHTKAARKLSGFGGIGKVVMGYELITAPLEIRQLEPIVYDLVYGLMSKGDFFSNRASTHFHIGFPHNLRMLKSLLRVSLMLDPLMYRLGGMGGNFRGNSNQACYARPLLNAACVSVIKGSGRTLEEIMQERRHRQLARELASGRIPAGTARSQMEIVERESEEEDSYTNFPFVQVINPMNALDAQDSATFWASFGINISNPTAHKYHPARYTGINFYALPSHGTIEFRHANFSRRPDLIIAVAKFLRGAVEMSALLGKAEIGRFEPIPSNEEISVSDSVEVISRVLEMARIKEVEDLPDDYELELLVRTIEESSFTSLPEQPVMTHVKDFALESKTAALGKLIPVESPLPPKHVDIHNIDLQSLFE